MTGPYLVVVERSGQGWRAEVQGVGSVKATLLSEVERRARKLVWANHGVPPWDIDLSVEVSLPASVRARLNLAEQLCEEATAEVEGVISFLVDLGLSATDVGAILRQRRGGREQAADDDVVDLGWRRSA